jgi:hypothetical protein
MILGVEWTRQRGGDFGPTAIGVSATAVSRGGSRSRSGVVAAETDQRATDYGSYWAARWT